jgi:hypothetical protein
MGRARCCAAARPPAAGGATVSPAVCPTCAQSETPSPAARAQVRAEPPELVCTRPDAAAVRRAAEAAAVAASEWGLRSGPLRTALVRRQLFFPDRRLLQFDCGKLQELAVLLRRLKAGGHRVLIFTQVGAAAGAVAERLARAPPCMAHRNTV